MVYNTLKKTSRPRSCCSSPNQGAKDGPAGNMVEVMWTKVKDEWHPAIVKEVQPNGGYTIDWRD